MSAATPASPAPSIPTLRGGVSQDYTETALRELYQQVNNMPESAKKKKLIRQVQSAPPRWDSECAQRTAANLALLFFAQFEKQPLQTGAADSRTPFSRKHWRSRSLGGIIKVISFGQLQLCYQFLKSGMFICFKCENRGKFWEARL